MAGTVGCMELPLFHLESMSLISGFMGIGWRENSVSEPQLQLRVLGFRLLQNWDVGVRVFPEGEEVPVIGARLAASCVCIGALCRFGLKRVSACEPQMSQRCNRFIAHNSAMINDLLELRSGSTGLLGGQVRLCAHIDRIQA